MCEVSKLRARLTEMRWWAFRTAVAAIMIAVGTIAAAPADAAEGTLVSKGNPAGCVVIREDTRKGRVMTAAKDIIGYISRISGAQLPLRRDGEQCPGFRILIGSTRLAPVDPTVVTEAKVGADGFIIRSVPNGVVIAGRIDHGTAHGVYHFAEEVLGVHWFSVEDDAPIRPKQSTIRIPDLDVTIKPDFAWRGQYYSFQQGEAYRTGKVPPPGKLGISREGWWTFNRLWPPFEVESGHAFFAMVPDELFEEHPEYFPFVDYRFEKSNDSAHPYANVIKTKTGKRQLWGGPPSDVCRTPKWSNEPSSGRPGSSRRTPEPSWRRSAPTMAGGGACATSAKPRGRPILTAT